MARPAFKPTPEQRLSVSIAAGGGMAHDDIAVALGIDRKTLEKHFEEDLSKGAMERRMEVLDSMHGAAAKGNVTAQRAYLERTPHSAIPPAPQPMLEQPEPGKGGKKAQAQRDAVTAQKGTTWDGLLPKVPGRLN